MCSKGRGSGGRTQRNWSDIDDEQKILCLERALVDNTQFFTFKEKEEFSLFLMIKIIIKHVYCVRIPLCRSVKTNTRHTVSVKQ